MVGYTAQIPGTKAGKARLRRLVLALVQQIEIETRRDGCINKWNTKPLVVDHILLVVAALLPQDDTIWIPPLCSG